MADPIYPLLRRILAAAPDPIPLTADEADLLDSHIESLPPSRRCAILGSVDAAYRRHLRCVLAVARRRAADAAAIPPAQERPPEGTAKRAARPDGSRAALIAALSHHHGYDSDRPLTLEPIGCKALARLAGVGAATASRYFADEFKGYTKYRLLCRDVERLAIALRLLNGDVAPHTLYGRIPPTEGRDAE